MGDKAELPPGEIPPDSLNEHPEIGAGIAAAGEMPGKEAGLYTTPVELDRGMVRLPFR